MDQSFKLSDGYKNWAAFVEEFRRIEESLLESKRVERLLVVRCNQLKSELVASGNKLHTVMSVRAEDERTMALLRKECDQSVATAMEAKLKEEQAMSLVSGLQADVEALQSQVGVLQSALWLERERANAAVKASRGAMGADSRVKAKEGSRTAMITMNPSSPESVAAADASVTAAEALATSSTGGRGGGLSSQRRHGFPAKRAAGGAPIAMETRGGPSRRPFTASAATIALRAQKHRRRPPTGGGAWGLYGEDSREFWGAGSGDACRGGGGNIGGNFGCFGAEGNVPTGTALTDPSLGLSGWESQVTEGGGGVGGDVQQDGRREPRVGHFALDIDGRRGCFPGGGGLANGGVEVGEIFTPFQKWKIDKGITSPGVAEMFAGRSCGSR